MDSFPGLDSGQSQGCKTGEGSGVRALLQTFKQAPTNCSTSLSISGHHIYDQANAFIFATPWWPLCNSCKIFSLRSEGTITLRPHTRQPWCTEISFFLGKYGTKSGVSYQSPVRAPFKIAASIESFLVLLAIDSCVMATIPDVNCKKINIVWQFLLDNIAAQIDWQSQEAVSITVISSHSVLNAIIVTRKKYGITMEGNNAGNKYGKK